MEVRSQLPLLRKIVVIAGGAANAIVASGVRGYDITGIKLTSTSAGGLVLMNQGRNGATPPTA